LTRSLLLATIGVDPVRSPLQRKIATLPRAATSVMVRVTVSNALGQQAAVSLLPDGRHAEGLQSPLGRASRQAAPVQNWSSFDPPWVSIKRIVEIMERLPMLEKHRPR
jgi:hypothetical protein